jgi:transposase-like protein
MDYEMEGKVQQEIEERVREGVKALFEQILEEEMDQHLGAGRYQRCLQSAGERRPRR